MSEDVVLPGGEHIEVESTALGVHAAQALGRDVTPFVVVKDVVKRYPASTRRRRWAGT